MAQCRDRKEQLPERKVGLFSRLKGIDLDLDPHQSRDREACAVEREADDTLERLGDAGLREVRMIDVALKRMGEGIYGICVQRGERISAKRLDRPPYTGLRRGRVAPSLRKAPRTNAIGSKT